MKFAITLFSTLAVFLTSVELGCSTLLATQGGEPTRLYIAAMKTKNAVGRYATLKQPYKCLTTHPPDEFTYAIEFQGYIRGLYIREYEEHTRIKLYKIIGKYVYIHQMSATEQDDYPVDKFIEPPPNVLIGQENGNSKWSHVRGLLLRSNSLKSSRENGESSTGNQNVMIPQNKAKYD